MGQMGGMGGMGMGDAGMGMEMSIGGEGGGGGMGGMGMGMGFGGGGGGGGGGGESQVTGIELYGHSVAMQARSAVGRAGRDTGAAKGANSETSATAKAEPRDPLQGAGDAKGEDAGDKEDGDKKRRVAEEPAATPELTYVARLRASELFDEDENFTGILLYLPPKVVQNLSTFSLQVKLTEPLSFFKASR